MEISIQISGGRLPTREIESVRQHVRQRVEETFARIKRRVIRVSVRLKDVSGVRGGLGKYCRVTVSLGGTTAALARGARPQSIRADQPGESVCRARDDGLSSRLVSDRHRNCKVR